MERLASAHFTSGLGLMHTAQPNDVCAPVAVEGLCSICRVEPGQRVVRVPTMILDMPNQMSILVGDLDLADVLCNGPVCKYEVPARVVRVVRRWSGIIPPVAPV